jgi:hypothetical protein
MIYVGYPYNPRAERPWIMEIPEKTAVQTKK